MKFNFESKKMKEIWSAIVITCSDQESADAFNKEMELRQKKMLIHQDILLLCVVDPKPNIGSGGATLNAILQIAENMSARKGYTVISSEVLQNKRVLILHMGTGTPYSACSPGFLPIPAFIGNTGNCSTQYSGLATLLDILMQMTINVMAEDSPYGFWVCSCDRMIIIPQDFKVNWKSSAAPVHMFAVPVDLLNAAKQHGVMKIAEDEVVEDILYKGSEGTLKQFVLDDGKVPVVSGLVFMTTAFAETLLNLCVIPPLDLCTYVGVDTGSRSRPLPSDDELVYRSESDFLLSLYFDILLCMTSNITRNEFVHGERSGVYGTEHFPESNYHGDRDLRLQARCTLWDALYKFPMKADILHGSEFYYMSNDPAVIHNLMLNWPHQNGMETSFASIKFRKTSSSLSLGDYKDSLDDKQIVVVNSIVNGATVGNNCVLLHSHIKKDISIGSNSLLINIHSKDLEPIQYIMELPDDVVIESFYLKMGTTIGSTRILIMFGMCDKLQKPMLLSESTFFNESWESFFERTGLSAQEIWSSDIPEKKRSLINARLYPVYHPKDEINILILLWMHGSYKSRSMANFWRASWRLSLVEILDLCDPHEEFSWRRQLFFDIGRKKVSNALLKKHGDCFLPFFGTCILNGYFEEILELLDGVILATNDSAIISRTFACIADVLGCKAGGLGGLRSGPAANHIWKPALDMVQNNNIKEAVNYMANVRKAWCCRPDLLVRAARHYEAAFQIQVRKAVSTARKFIKLTKTEMVAMDTWVKAEASARSDIAGTWSDTPPVCYENSGIVLTMAINFDDQKPIGCRLKRIPECKIVLILGRDNPVTLELHKWNELMNYSQPNSPGALLKAAFFSAEILPLKHHCEALSDYLFTNYQGGFMLNTWSNLPHGSGLGTSSILAGTVLSALWTVVGYKHDVDSVLHAVLDLEQMLTTGGGWQDQVGGLCPGIKVGSSRNQLPLEIKVNYIKCPDGFVEKLEKHLLVMFTGKTRLARNMLQDVLRNWNARFPEIVHTAAELIENAERAVTAMQQGDIEGIGKCMQENWKHKKLMAHGCEPAVCREIMDQLEPFVHGQCLAGAGGGGFMYLITKEENAFDKINEELSKVENAFGKATLHQVTIDSAGLTVKIDDQPSYDLSF